MNEFDTFCREFGMSTQTTVETEQRVQSGALLLGFNKELLEGVAQFIESHPERFDMYVWQAGQPPFIVRLFQKVLRFVLRSPDPKTGECIACHTLRLTGHDPTDFDNNVPALAQEILGLSDSQAVNLFFPDHWPEPYNEIFFRSKDASDRMASAWIAARRIRHFIETGE